jgi:poly-gamma-glutamate synthesis protein (capsule biosynthesis protein)
MQPLALHRGRPIIGGLGNFVFHTKRPGTYDEKGVDVWRSAAVRISMDDEGTCVGVEILPVSVGRPGSEGIQPLAPVPLCGEHALEIFNRAVSELSAGDRKLFRLFSDE